MITRRSILQILPTLGISSTVFGKALALEAERSDELTQEMIDNAQWVSGVELTELQRDGVLKKVNSLQQQLKPLREFELSPQDDLSATHFQPIKLPAANSAAITRNAVPMEWACLKPAMNEDLAFCSVVELAALVRSRQVTSVELTKLYLERLKRFDPILKCVVTLTEDLALRQAARADLEIAAGKYRGPLHGIPWGAKDLIGVPGYPTTWGIPVFETREVTQLATVAARLEEAGAVLVAKLSLGAIAMGDKWFRGVTRNPWNPQVGSSGSSAGSAAAVSAGLVGFAIGSETLGSILSPSTRCGTHGLRPTFGRVSRAGCMPLSWTMDKLGPLARSVQDLALVLDAIHGPDGKDPTVVSAPFAWPPTTRDWSQLRVGYTLPKREGARPDESLEILRGLGCQLVEVKLPEGFPLFSLTSIIDIEGASVFNDLLREGKTEGWNTWTESFQSAQFITAIDYLRMQRVRRRLMHAFEESIREVDVLWNVSRDLIYTNLTGHPSVVLPFKAPAEGQATAPRNVVVTGHLYQEEVILALAHAFESQLEVLPNPPMEQWLAKFEQGEWNLEQLEEPERPTPEKETPKDPPKQAAKDASKGG